MFAHAVHITRKLLKDARDFVKLQVAAMSAFFQSFFVYEQWLGIEFLNPVGHHIEGTEMRQAYRQIVQINGFPVVQVFY